jgi:hypothetical protein
MSRRPDSFMSTIAALEAAACDSAAACSVDPQCLQDLIAAVVRVYAARRAAGNELPAFRANAGESQPTATDVVIMVSALLDSAKIEVFELGMWQAWGSPG